MTEKIIKSNVVNKDIILLYEKYNEIIFNSKIPVLYNEFEKDKNQLLFIGLNPSFSDNLIKGYNGTKDEYNNFFQSRELGDVEIKEIIKVHEESIKNYPYFSKFEAIANDTGKAFAHIDLFHCRRTSQSELVKILENKHSEKKLDKKDSEIFINKSVEILNELINQIKPKIIIVENAKTRDILSKHFPSITDIHDTYGTPLLNNKIPIFYTSMLTGQRALDLGSYHRLVWHIKHCISILEK
jgi:hypothetical protein